MTLDQVRKTKLIYLAGPYSCDAHCKPLGVDLLKMKKGIDTSALIMSLGFAVISPWIDYQLALSEYGNSLTRTDFYRNGLRLLLAADAVYVIELRDDSQGTMEEIKLANKAGIPVFYSTREVLEWADRINLTSG